MVGRTLEEAFSLLSDSDVLAGANSLHPPKRPNQTGGKTPPPEFVQPYPTAATPVPHSAEKSSVGLFRRNQMKRAKKRKTPHALVKRSEKKRKKIQAPPSLKTQKGLARPPLWSRSLVPGSGAEIDQIIPTN